MVVSTHLKNIREFGSSPQVGMKIKNIWNHHPVSISASLKFEGGAAGSAGRVCGIAPTLWPQVYPNMFYKLFGFFGHPRHNTSTEFRIHVAWKTLGHPCVSVSLKDGRFFRTMVQALSKNLYNSDDPQLQNPPGLQASRFTRLQRSCTKCFKGDGPLRRRRIVLRKRIFGYKDGAMRIPQTIGFFKWIKKWWCSTTISIHFLFVMIWDFWGAQQKKCEENQPKKPTNSPPPQHGWILRERTWLDFRVISWEVDHQDRCQCGSPLPGPRYAWKGDPNIPRGGKVHLNPPPNGEKKKRGKPQGHLGKGWYGFFTFWHPELLLEEN